MKITVIAPNQTLARFDDGREMFQSYQTPVALYIPSQGFYITSDKYSRTTSKHITQQLRRWGCSQPIYVNAARLAELINV